MVYFFVQQRKTDPEPKQNSPNGLERMTFLQAQRLIYESIREKYLEPCLNFIMRGDNLACKKLYVEMVTELKKIYA